MTDQAAFVAALAGLAFLALLIYADAKRRYGSEIAYRYAVGAVLLCVVVVPAYLIYRVGHAPTIREGKA